MFFRITHGLKDLVASLYMYTSDAERYYFKHIKLLSIEGSANIVIN